MKKVYFDLDNPPHIWYHTTCITPKTAGAARRKFQTPAEEKLHKVHVMEFWDLFANLREELFLYFQSVGTKYYKEVQSWQSVQFVRRVLISETMLAIPIEEVMRFGSPMLSPLE